MVSGAYVIDAENLEDGGRQKGLNEKSAWNQYRVRKIFF